MPTSQLILGKISSDKFAIPLRDTTLKYPLPTLGIALNKEETWNVCFVICHQYSKRPGKIKANKTQQISAKTKDFLSKLNYNIFNYNS